MSEDEARRAGNEEQGDEVEAHKHLKAANDEGATEGDDDVEAHSFRKQAPKKV